MMRRTIYLAAISTLVAACQFTGETTSESEFKHPDEIVNPNGDSELSIVMRYLHFEAEKIRESLEKGESPDYTEFNRLVAEVDAAEPTDASVLDEEFYSFSKHLSQNTDEMNEGGVEAFNNMLSSCVACHKMTCPGPISKIEKLRINS